MKKEFILGLLLMLCCFQLVQAQDSVVILPHEEIILPVTVQEASDTLFTVSEKELPDLRIRLQQLNAEYITPKKPTEKLLRLLNKDVLEMSPKALALLAAKNDTTNRFDASVTFRDTVIADPIFMPLLFRGKHLPKDLTFYDKNLFAPRYTPRPLWKGDSIFTDYTRTREAEQEIAAYMERNYPAYFRYSERSLPKEAVKPQIVEKDLDKNFPLKVERELNVEEIGAPAKFIPERRYWTSSFESTLQFAQNYVSPNWYNGGNSTLNLNNREYLTYNYEKDRVKITNEFELKNNIYTAPNDTLRNYNVGDDLFRIHSNVGYQAFSKWYYTFDFEFKTQIFSSYEENSDVKKAGLLSPFSFTIGLGMKYDLSKTFEKKNKSLAFNVNIAPLSYTYRKTIDEDIKLESHFQVKKNGEYPTSENLFGATISATLDFKFNRNVSWYSRFYYNTSYQRIIGEWENRFSFAWSRFFSTNITMNMRYDDGVAKNEDFDSYLQINELLSLGFNYKW